jgi:spore coat protein H
MGLLFIIYPGRVAWISALFVAIMVLGAGAAEQSRKNEQDLDDLFNGKFLPRIQIEIPPEGMKVLRAYNQVWGQPKPERIDVQATVREGGKVYTNVAIHLKGSYSFQPIDAKPSFTLNFEKGASGQSFHGLSKMHLNNSAQDPTYLSEKFARDLFREVGVPSTRIGHALVTINGRKAGLYTLVEGWGKSFLKQHFASTKGNLYDAGSGGDITKNLDVDSGENREDRSSLTNLVAACRIKDLKARHAKLQELLDVERFLNFVATEIFIVHWDGYAMGPNNFKVFHDASRNKMVFMPHGLDQTFGVSRSPEMSITPQFKGTAAKALLAIPEERQRLFARLASLSTNEFSLERLNARLDRLVEPLGLALKNEPEILLGIMGPLENMRARMARRSQSVASQLLNPTPTVAFNPNNELPLRSWRFKSGNTRPTSGRRMRQNGQEVLQVVVNNGPSTGSWRTSVLLEAGTYELCGDARVQGLTDTKGTNGVILRASGERSVEGISTNSEWKNFRYEFDVRGIEDVELVCEYRGGSGLGEFNVNTLKLVRKTVKKD